MLRPTIISVALSLVCSCYRSSEAKLDGAPDGGTDSDSESESDVDDPCGDEQADLGWVTAIASPSGVWAREIALSPDGEILVAGYLTGSAVFGAGEPIQIPLESTADDAAFLAKYEADGTLSWATCLTDSEKDSQSLGLAVSPAGEIFVAGSFGGQAVFGPGDPGATTIGSSDSTDDGFVAKYDSDGEIMWATRIGGPGGPDTVMAVEALADGSIVVTGEIGVAEAVFGEGQSGETSLEPLSSKDLFVARYHGDGTFDWVQHAGGAQDEVLVSSVARLGGDALVVTGLFHKEVTFDIGGPNETVVAVSDGLFSGSLFVAAYGVDGSFEWVRAPGPGYGSHVELAGDDRSILTGVFEESIIFGEGEVGETELIATGDNDDVFVASYEADGSLEWARQIWAEEGVSSGALSVFPSGAYLVGGAFQSSLRLEQGLEDVCVLDSAGNNDGWLAQYNASGELQWGFRFGAEESDGIHSVVVTEDGGFVVCGWFEETVVFGEGGSAETELVAPSGRDAFIARFGP